MVLQERVLRVGLKIYYQIVLEKYPFHKVLP